jgi:hypothetical protein
MELWPSDHERLYVQGYNEKAKIVYAAPAGDMLNETSISSSM